ncbi:MAG: homoserine dehydrogenase [Patescibacteria group bacterium]
MTAKSIALLGHGTIGSEFYRQYRLNRDYYARLTGTDVSIVCVAVRDPSKHTESVPENMLVTDIDEAVKNPRIGIVVSVLGNEEAEYYAIKTALEHGKIVVTANKKVLAKYWHELGKHIYPFGNKLLFEAAVCAGIQIIDNLLNRYLPNYFSCCEGIVNGTTNYIFTQMMERGWPFAKALKVAQRLGYAEPDPTDDVEGHDAAYKLSILASLAYSTHIPPDSIHREGMTAKKGLGAIKEEDWFYAKKYGSAFKLIASARVLDGAVHPWVAPAYVPAYHLLRNVGGSLNGLYLKSEPLGETQLVGRGAGPGPTASSLWSDVLTALTRTPTERMQDNSWSGYAVAGSDEYMSCHYIRMSVHNRKGVLGSIGSIFANHGVSVEQFIQPHEGKGEGEEEMITLTEPSNQRHLRRALDEIRKEDYCIGIGTVLHAVN